MRLIQNAIIYSCAAGFPECFIWDIAEKLITENLSPSSWTELGGPSALKAAITDHDIDAIDSAVLLAGELRVRKLLPLHVFDEFSPLCEYLATELLPAGPSDHDIFYMLREDIVSSKDAEPESVLAFTPSAHLHLLCPNMPVMMKTGILIERVVRHLAEGSVQEALQLPSTCYKPQVREDDSLGRSLMHLLSMEPVFLLRGGWEVRYEGSNVGGGGVSRDWLSKLWEKVLAQHMLGLKSNISAGEVCDLRAVGRAIALSLLARVPIGVELDISLLSDLLLPKSPHTTHPMAFGFQEVIPMELIRDLFSPEELGVALTGEDHVLTAAELIPYIQSILPTPKSLHAHLIRFLSEPISDRPSKFVRFVTGLALLPVGGLRTLPYPIYVQVGEFKSERPYPQAMLCSQTLLLPHYSSYEQLERFLGEAIEQEDLNLKE